MNFKEYVDNAIDLKKLTESDILLYKTNKDESEYLFDFYEIDFVNFFKNFQNDYLYKMTSKLANYVYDKNLKKGLFIKDNVFEEIYDYISDFLFDNFDVRKHTKKILFEFELETNKEKKFYNSKDDYFFIEENLDAFIYEKTQNLNFFKNNKYSLFFKYNLYNILNESILEIKDWYLKNNKNEILKGNFEIKIKKEILFSYKIKEIKKKTTNKIIEDYEDVFRKERIKNIFKY